jgi:hypothetical protein
MSAPIQRQRVAIERNATGMSSPAKTLLGTGLIFSLLGGRSVPFVSIA